MENKSYFSGLFSGIKSLCTGLKVTGRELFTKKVTERYPENRKTNELPERFRGVLVMPHNEKNEHKCIGCGICEMQCPNGTIKVESEMVEVDGKKKKQLVRYIYDHGCCMYCMLCTRACPQGAITFAPEYECAVFSRDALIMQLNQPGSKCEEKPAPARPAAAPKPAAAAAESQPVAGNATPDAAPAAPAADSAADEKMAKLMAASKKAADNAAAAKAAAEEAAAKAAAAPEDAELKAAAEEAAAKAAKLATAAENFAKKVAEAQQ